MRVLHSQLWIGKRSVEVNRARIVFQTHCDFLKQEMQLRYRGTTLRADASPPVVGRYEFGFAVQDASAQIEDAAECAPVVARQVERIVIHCEPQTKGKRRGYKLSIRIVASACGPELQ